MPLFGPPTPAQIEKLRALYAGHTLPHDREIDPRVEKLVVDLIGRVADKWTMIILEVLVEHGELRFTQLSRLVTGISQKMLTQTVRQMERDGRSSARFIPWCRRRSSTESPNWASRSAPRFAAYGCGRRTTCRKSMRHDAGSTTRQRNQRPERAARQRTPAGRASCSRLVMASTSEFSRRCNQPAVHLGRVASSTHRRYRTGSSRDRPFVRSLRRPP
jgi:hypothetical protein